VLGTLTVQPRGAAPEEFVMSARHFERLELSQAEPETSKDYLFELGLLHSTGRSAPADFLAAHKWFNLSAQRGNEMAARLRSEIAAEMSASEVASAQRAAREWMTKH
jgi:TPR repeat protein